MPTADEITARLEALRAIRGTGALTVVFPDRSAVTYRSDDELRAAIADLERQLADLAGSTVHTILVSSSKGLEA